MSTKNQPGCQLPWARHFFIKNSSPAIAVGLVAFRHRPKRWSLPFALCTYTRRMCGSCPFNTLRGRWTAQFRWAIDWTSPLSLPVMMDHWVIPTDHSRTVLISILATSLFGRTTWETDLKGHYHTTYTRNTFRMTVFVHSVIMLCKKRELGKGNSSGWLNNANGSTNAIQGSGPTSMFSNCTAPRYITMWLLFLLLSLYPSRVELFFKLSIKSCLDAKVINPANTWFQKDSRVLLKEVLQLKLPLPKMAVHPFQMLIAQSAARLTTLTSRNSTFILIRRFFSDCSSCHVVMGSCNFLVWIPCRNCLWFWSVSTYTVLYSSI